MSLQTQHVTFPTDGDTGKGYLALPDRPVPHYAIIAIQEWCGLNERIKMPPATLEMARAAEQSIPPARHAALDTARNQTSIPHAIQVYPDALHAFFNDTQPAANRHAAAADAWQRPLDRLDA
jgi:dienelactone hydrolase